MANVTIELHKLHPMQAQIVKESALRNVWISGRQSGKTALSHYLIVMAMLQAKDCGLFAPTFKTASESWRALKDKLADVTAEKDEQERRLAIHANGGKRGSLEVWSLDDPDSGRGRQYDLVVIDEAGQVRNLEAAWASIQPMLAIRRGVAWIISTPTGAGTYLHNLFSKGKGLFRGSWRSWQTGSSCNPFMPKATIEDARQDLSERGFSQEYEGEWVSWEGAVFTALNESLLSGAPQGKAAIIGVDWAGASGSGDYTVFCTLSDSGEVLDLTRLRGEPFVQQRARLNGIWERFGRPPVLAEQNGMGAVQNAELRNEGVHVQDWITTNASKTEIVSKLVQAFEQRAIRIPNDENLLAELRTFQCTPLAGGQFRYAAPPGLHDDMVMGLAIAYAGMGNAVKRNTDARFLKAAMEGNLRELTAPSPYRLGGASSLSTRIDGTDPWFDSVSSRRQ